MNWFAVAVGGAIGASCRYAIGIAFASDSSRFPLATFLANGFGCFMMGVGAFFIIEKSMMGGDLARHFYLVGMLGALTTYSSFSLEAICLLEKQNYVLALSYVFGTLITCLLGTAGGFAFAKVVLN